MIEISKLTDVDRGKRVRYNSGGGYKIETGVITSWNEKFIFVRYTQVLYPNTPRARHGSTSEATAPEDLSWE